MKGRVRLKSEDDIERIGESGRVIGEIFADLMSMDIEGLSSWELDAFIEREIFKRRARPAFKTIRGYEFASCISVNDEVAHGVPSKKKVFTKGDIVKVDSGAVLNGFFCDSCVTLMVGQVSPHAMELVPIARRAMFMGVETMVPGNYIGDIGHAVSSYIKSQGCSVVKRFTGHGVGFALHEPPVVPHRGEKGKGLRLQEGMVLTCEPAVNRGREEVRLLPDGWTFVTDDGNLSAQFEHTVAITSRGPRILTLA